MRIADFKGELTAGGQIAVPSEIASQVQPGEAVEVVLRWRLTEDADAWLAAGRKQFEAAYSDEDSVYEELID